MNIKKLIGRAFSGFRKKKIPHSFVKDNWFNAAWYLETNNNILSPDNSPTYHYLHYGIYNGKLPNEAVSDDFVPTLEQRLTLLRTCDWFDSIWYLQYYPDVAAAGIDPAFHYLQHGISEGRSPSERFVKNEPGPPIDFRLALLEASEWFDANWYLTQYPDVATAGIDASSHYLFFGAAEGRHPGPLFDEGYYLSQLNGPLDQPSGFLHYLVEGKDAGLKPVRSWSDAPWWWQLTPPAVQKVDWRYLKQLESLPLPVVVIPVFNAAAALSECLASLTQYRRGLGKVIVINDASTDPAINDVLKRYEQDLLFHCFHNEHNLGFSGTVNRGLSLAADADVILLNSDTKVTAGFVQRLRLTAYSNTKVATVTPLSNNAGVFSVPCPGENEVPAQFGLTRFARAVAQAAVSLPISVPTGHGFCMYIRRDALDETGLFDANAFPRGYGEENDFCRRSAALGWQHLVDCRTYIYHQGSASFSTDKQALLKAGKAILDQRYPDYAELVQKSFGGLPIRHLRQQIAMLARIPAPNAIHIKPRVLYVISSLMGGTPQTNQDLMLALAAEYECFVLHCDSKELTLRHYAEGIYMEIATHTLHAPIQALPHKSDEYDQVVAHWLMQWSIELVHIRHIAWHSLGLLPVIKSLGIILINSFHDFYTLCPNVKLLDNTQQYCAAKCTQSQGDCSHELWPKDAFFSLKNNQVHQWQQMFAETLQYCDAFVTTNQSTKALFLQRYPGLSNKPFTVIEHGRDFTHFEKLSVKPEPGETLRLLCPGNIGDAKGLQLILQLANRRQDVEIHILGIVTEDVALPANVVIHGSYVREQFFSRVAQIKPHCGAVLSIWPETWCHTLTEMWAAGIPVIAVDIGAVGERIRQHSTGWLMYQNTVECLEETIDLARSSPDWEKKFQAVMDWQTHEGAGQTCSAMATYYAQLYKTFLS